MKIKTAELTGSTLDWAVAKCEGEWCLDVSVEESPNFPAYSIDWGISGLIIEREKISISYDYDSSGKEFYRAQNYLLGVNTKGKTHLEAAMRCYVASKLGNEVEIPKELLE